MSDFQINDNQIFFQHNQGDRGNRPVYSLKFKVLGKTIEVALWPAKSKKEGSYSGSIKFVESEAEQQPATHKGFDRQGDIPPSNPVETDEIPF